MRRIARYLSLTATLLGSSFAYAVDLPNYDAYYDAPALQPITSRGAQDARAFGIVTSVDAQTGVPSFVWASKELKQLLPMLPGVSAERAALLYVEKLAPLYRLSKPAIGTAYVKHVHDLGRGAIIVSLGQNVNGIDVFLTEMNVVMNRNLELVAIGGSLHEMGVPSLKGSDTSYVISPNQALVNAWEDLYGITLKPSSVKDTKMQKGGAHYFDFVQTPEVIAMQMKFDEPARVKKMFFPMPDRLVAAYWVEFFSAKTDNSTLDAYAFVIAADDGRVLNRTNLTYSFNYRVWADAAGDKRPLDGPIADWTPHPVGLPNNGSPPSIPPVMVSMDGFNTNPQNTFDPWLPAGAMVTTGNNVNAYTDHTNNGESMADIRGTTTSANTFDHTYNTSQAPLANQTQSRASVVQLFYVNNWLHDWWYDSGFNESAGNAQQNNFGRGGQEGDPIRAEAQDGASVGDSNNANMSTGGDGTSPRMQMYVWTATNPDRDGTIDNHIVAHEWGHYIHLRQVGGGSAQVGAMSEGWGDFTALHMSVRPGDNLMGTYGAGIYAPAGIHDSSYFGIRRFAYSGNMNKNCLTFRHIGDNQAIPGNCPRSNQIGAPENSEVHNAGEVWCMMAFESYLSLLGGHPVPEGQRLMTDYVQGGYQAAPPNPNFTEQRDAILATAAATNVTDLIALAQGFAKRGAGTCAVSPPKNSTTLNGVVEDYMLRPRIGPVTLTVDDSIYSCDDDGALDGEEKGYVNIAVQNTGVAPLNNTQITLSTTTAGVTFPNGTTATLASVAPFATGIAQIEINADNSFTQITPLDLSVALTNPTACTTTANATATININIDNTPMSSTTDTVESDLPVWATEQGGAGYDAWLRELGTPGNYLWHGEDVAQPSDPRLISPPLNVSPTQNFTLTITHRYQFEFSMGTFWDGGVIEISPDNGASWNDIEMYGQAPYNGIIGDGPGGAVNVLDDRQGFVDNNPNWPNTNTITINMGTSLAGQTVLVRFRIGTDDAVGDQGWFIDDFAFQGITNTPFATISPDVAICTMGTGGSGGTGAGTGGAGTGGTGAGGAGTGGTGAGGAGTGGTGAGTGGAGTGGTGGTGAGTGGTGTGGTGTGGTGTGGTGTGGMGPASSSSGVSSSSSMSASSGMSSSSTLSGSGTGAGGGASGGDAPTGDEGGCSCSTVGNSSTSSTSFSPLAALALLALRRRRRTENRSRS